MSLVSAKNGIFLKGMMTLSGQELLDYIGENLTVTYEVTDNTGEICESKITFENNGDHTVSNSGWSIYMYHLRQIASESVEIDIDHSVGGLFKLSPTDEFMELKPGKVLEVILSSENPTVSRYSLFPNWYVAKPGLHSRLLRSTQGEALSYVKPFDNAKKWKQSKKDESNPYTPLERFKRFEVKDHGKACKPVIPTLLEADLNESDSIILSEGSWVIYNACSSFHREVDLLADHLKMNQMSSEEPGPKPSSHIIHFTQGKVENIHSSEEAYLIKLDKSKPSIEITSPSAAGTYYAVQTIISLLQTSNVEQKILPSGLIRDAPRFPYRGLHLDVSRNFASAQEVIKIIRVISAYKMNKLHFHLTDDEGWRLEIKDLPELTEIGSVRDHNLSLKGLAVEPTLGSGPDSTTLGSGYYTVEDYRSILQAAAKHHVEVIPEIDMPGHSYAAIIAMSARYEKFKELGNREAGLEYLLTEEADEPSYVSVQRYMKNTMNPCVNGTKRFIEKIITTLKELHEPIQPLKVFHVGGDEVPLEAWDGSPKCQQFHLKNKGKTVKRTSHAADEEDEDNGMVSALQEHFINDVEGICKKHDLQLAVWNDGIHDPTTKQNADDAKMVHAWRISQKNDRHNPYMLANNGYKVVISSATHTYLDHPYEPDPEENGLHWCVRTLDAKTMFQMKPFDMYSCQRKPSKFQHEKLKNKSAIIGIQVQIWRELMRTDEMVELMLFPRILAAAERSWHEAAWEDSCDASESQEKDWGEFANTVGYKELRRMEKHGIHYRIPPPGICVKDAMVLINTAYPDLRYQYRKKGNEKWEECHGALVSDCEPGSTYEFSTASFDGKRRSRIVDFSL